VKYSFSTDFKDGAIDFSLNLGTYKALNQLLKLYLQSEREVEEKKALVEYMFEKSGETVFNPRFLFAGDASSWLIDRLGLKDDEVLPRTVFLASVWLRELFKR
jgi:hypothetical protein